MLWLLRLQFKILDPFSFFAHFEVPHCHHANHKYITDISCSSTVPQVISKLRSRHLSSSMSSPFLQLNLTRSPNQGCCFTCNARGPHMFGAHARDAALFQAPLGRCHLRHITQVFFGRMPNRMGDCVQKWKLLSLVPDACYCRFDNIHETTAVVRTSLKKRLMKINEVDSCK